MTELAADPARRAAYGRAGRADVTARTWESVGDRLLEHYRLALAAHHGTALSVASPALPTAPAPAFPEEQPA
ncbi:MULTISPECIES: hypothetical protein [Kitasatospora]|uniref:Uncharacterized protein n=1 Tax=Kitasatospora cystarginea TaxID=58350 RepID=A0ABN3E717_9ACTN